MQIDDTPALLGTDPRFLAMQGEVARLAPLDRPILVIGERGTGKELVSARLHFLSPRWDRPFVKINCAALSEDLLDSELFGHEAGAFTGANRRRAGRFEQADGGTLFLDEIATASSRVQEKILRVVEYGEVERLGGDRVVRVDTRVIAATNVDLPAAVAAGRFRADLLDRLAFDVVTLPPLRARPDDIALLAETFGTAIATESGLPFPGFAPSAMADMEAHDWPGNVRELRNAVERSVHRWLHGPTPGKPVATLSVDPFDSPFRPSEPASRAGNALPGAHGVALPNFAQPFDLSAMLGELEAAALEAALAANRHNQREAAAHLGLTYHQFRGLYRKHTPAGGKADASA